METTASIGAGGRELTTIG